MLRKNLLHDFMIFLTRNFLFLISFSTRKLEARSFIPSHLFQSIIRRYLQLIFVLSRNEIGGEKKVALEEKWGKLRKTLPPSTSDELFLLLSQEVHKERKLLIKLITIKSLHEC